MDKHKAETKLTELEEKVRVAISQTWEQAAQALLIQSNTESCECPILLRVIARLFQKQSRLGGKE